MLESSDGDSGLFVEQVLEYGKRTYTSVAKLGVEALELKIAGYSGTDMKRVKEFVLKTGILSVGFGLFAAVICIGLRNIILTAFIKDATILEYGKTLVFGCFCTAPIYGLFQLSVNFLQATERPLWSTALTLLRQGIIIIPAMLLLNYIAGFRGLASCFAVTDIFAAGIGLLLTQKR